MAEKKVNNKLMVRGIAAYPKTNKPVKYDQVAKRSVYDADGSYELTIIISTDQAAKLDARLRQFAAEKGLKKIKNMPLSEQIDAEGNETGKWVLKAKQYGKNKDGSVKRILHVDGATRPLGKDFVLTSGSEINLDAYLTTYEQLGGGVRVNINAIQVIKYVEYEATGGFQPEEGAWTSDETEEESAFEVVGGEDPTDF